MRYVLYGWTHESFGNYNRGCIDDDSQFFIDLENDEKTLIDYAIKINESDDYNKIVNQQKTMINDSKIVEDVRAIYIWDNEDATWIL